MSLTNTEAPVQQPPNKSRAGRKGNQSSPVKISIPWLLKEHRTHTKKIKKKPFLHKPPISTIWLHQDHDINRLVKKKIWKKQELANDIPHKLLTCWCKGDLNPPRKITSLIKSCVYIFLKHFPVNNVSMFPDILETLYIMALVAIKRMQHKSIWHK